MHCLNHYVWRVKFKGGAVYVVTVYRGFSLWSASFNSGWHAMSRKQRQSREEIGDESRPDFLFWSIPHLLKASQGAINPHNLIFFQKSCPWTHEPLGGHLGTNQSILHKEVFMSLWELGEQLYILVTFLFIVTQYLTPTIERSTSLFWLKVCRGYSL